MTNIHKINYLIAIFFISLSAMAPQKGYSQELKCKVQVVSPKIEGTNKAVFETMQLALTEFMNGQKWTENVFAENEKIECSFLINITNVISESEFSGTIKVQAMRPVYGSSYQTVLFNRLDEYFTCKYTENQPLSYNPASFDSNLIGILAFYANMIIGYDYDSFSLLGGTPYFVQAQQIVTRAQGTDASGWKAFENRRNRYWIVNEQLNEQVKPLRNSYYKYHRIGLDNMYSKAVSARGDMMDALNQIGKVTRVVPSNLAVQIFFDTKSQEIINIFSESNQLEKSSILTLLNEIDPTNSTKYQTAFGGNK